MASRLGTWGRIARSARRSNGERSSRSIDQPPSRPDSRACRGDRRIEDAARGSWRQVCSTETSGKAPATFQIANATGIHGQRGDRSSRSLRQNSRPAMRACDHRRTQQVEGRSAQAERVDSAGGNVQRSGYGLVQWARTGDYVGIVHLSFAFYVLLAEHGRAMIGRAVRSESSGRSPDEQRRSTSSELRYPHRSEHHGTLGRLER